MLIAADPLPAWLQIAERFGVSFLLLVFALLVAWKLVPHLIAWFKASIQSAHTVNDAVPRIEKNLEEIAKGSKGMNSVAAATARTEQKTDRLLEQGARLQDRTQEILEEVRQRKRDTG